MTLTHIVGSARKWKTNADATRSWDEKTKTRGDETETEAPANTTVLEAGHVERACATTVASPTEAKVQWGRGGGHVGEGQGIGLQF